MHDLTLFLVHLIVTITHLFGNGGARSIVVSCCRSASFSSTRSSCVPALNLGSSDDSQPLEHSRKSTPTVRKKATKSIQKIIQEGQLHFEPRHEKYEFIKQALSFLTLVSSLRSIVQYEI